MSHIEINDCTFCVNCTGELEEIGGLQFRICPHYICLVCITELASSANKKTIRCATNKANESILCRGFLNLVDLEWVIPQDVFETWKERVENSKGEEQSPSTSTKHLECTVDDENNDDDDDLSSSPIQTPHAPGLTFEELDLTFEELTSGWGQIASSIVELQESGLSFEEANSQMDLIPLWTTSINPISCPICLEDIDEGGIILRGCFHIFCRDCLSKHITHCKEPEVICPFRQDDYACSSMLKPKEVENLVPRQIYVQHYETMSLEEVEKASPDTFHCLTPNCSGFCFIDQSGAGGVIFPCPKCGGRNCTQCRVLHPGSCAAYQRGIREEEERKQQLAIDARNRITQRENERLSEAMINGNINHRNFMRCPQCNIPCYKISGCNHVVCGSCRYKFDWSGNEPNQFR